MYAAACCGRHCAFSMHVYAVTACQQALSTKCLRMLRRVTAGTAHFQCTCMPTASSLHDNVNFVDPLLQQFNVKSISRSLLLNHAVNSAKQPDTAVSEPIKYDVVSIYL